MSRDIYIGLLHIITRVVNDEYVVVDIDDVQVQPKIEELLPNMEDNEDAASRPPEEAHLGKLEFSIDYDFQRQDVGVSADLRNNDVA